MVANVGRHTRATRSMMPQVEIGQVLVDAVDQFRLVVEGQADLGEAHQRPREPEVALQRDPDDRLAAVLERGPGPHRLDRRAVIGEELRPQPQVIVHVRDDPLDVMLHGLDRRVGGREPELLVGIEAEILGDVEDGVQLGRAGPPASSGQSSCPTTWPIPSAAADPPAGSPSRPGIARRGSWPPS